MMHEIVSAIYRSQHRVSLRLAVPAGDSFVESYCSALRQRFQRQTSLPNAIEEWFFRTYASVKLILSSTVMLSSANYAAEKGLRIVEPYLLYYALFNTSRALVLLFPEQQWQDGKLLEESTHEKVRNVTVDQLRYLSQDLAHEYQDLAQRALVIRELFSYRFPATGLKNEIEKLLPDYEDIVVVCRYVAEAAQLYSECLEKAFSKVGRPSGEFSETALRRVFEYEHKLFGDFLMQDSDDYHRLGRALRSFGRPVSLALTATEGLVEDFFAAWDFSEVGLDAYKPDLSDWDLIFPVH
jgi:hypothetical protein